MKPLKLAVVGAGQHNIATHSHLPAIDRSENIELVALCDIKPEVQEYADKYGVKAYNDLDEMLADGQIEAVVIATPDWLHRDQCIRAANAGKHILCEKPVCMSMTELDDIQAAVEKNDVLFMAGHSRRFMPIAKRIREVIDSGELGEVVSVRVTTKGAFFPYPKGSRYYKKESGGQFLHNGPHYVDWLCDFAGGNVEHVSITQRSFYPDPEEAMENPNYTFAAVRFDNGVIGCVEQNLTLLNPRGYPAKDRVEIIGTKSTIKWSSDEDATMFNYWGGCGYSDPNVMGTANDPFLCQINHFADCIRNSQPCLCSLENTRERMKIVLAAIE